jgi:transcriptional regulator with XRE-family HTH domain
MKDLLKDRLRLAMDSKGLKAVDLCERGNIPKSAMSYYLSGRQEPKSDRLYLLAKLLDVSEAWLLGYDVPMERSPDQKEADEMAALFGRIKKDRDFKQLIFRINRLTPAQLDAVKTLLVAFPD